MKQVEIAKRKNINEKQQQQQQQHCITSINYVEHFLVVIKRVYS